MNLDRCPAWQGYVRHAWTDRGAGDDVDVCADCGAERRPVHLAPRRISAWRILLCRAIARGCRLIGDRELANEIDELVSIARIRRRLDREVRSR